MAEKKKEVIIRASKQETFDILKAAAPGIFGAKVYADVNRFEEDPTDASNLWIVFNEESDS